MPYKSKAQQRKFHALQREGKISPEVVREWDDSTKRERGGFAGLPEKKTLPQTRGKKAGLILMAKHFLEKEKAAPSNSTPPSPSNNIGEGRKFIVDERGRILGIYRDDSSIIKLNKEASLYKEAISTKNIKRMVEAIKKNQTHFEHPLIQKSTFGDLIRSNSEEGKIQFSETKASDLVKELDKNAERHRAGEVGKPSGYLRSGYVEDAEDRVDDRYFGGKIFSPNNIGVYRIKSYHGQKEISPVAFLYEIEEAKAKKDFYKSKGSLVGPPTGHLGKDVVGNKNIKQNINPTNSYKFHKFQRPGILHSKKTNDERQAMSSYEQIFHKDWLSKNVKSTGTIYRERPDPRGESLKLSLSKKEEYLKNKKKYVKRDYFDKQFDKDVPNLKKFLESRLQYTNKTKTPLWFNRDGAAIIDHIDNDLPKNIFIKSKGDSSIPEGVFREDKKTPLRINLKRKGNSRWFSKNLGVGMGYSTEEGGIAGSSYFYKPNNPKSTYIQEELKKKGFLK